MTAEPSLTLSLGWTPGSLPLGSHVCLYYSDEPSLRRTMAFLQAGLEGSGELCIIFADNSRHEQLLDWLADESSAEEVAAAVTSGKLVCVGGAPDGPSLAANIVGALDAGMAAGFTVVRLLGFIAWGSPGWPDDASLLEFEDRVNGVVADYPAVVVCTYGVPSLTGTQLIHAGLGTHPTVVIGDTPIRANSLYRFHHAGPATQPQAEPAGSE